MQDIEIFIKHLFTLRSLLRTVSLYCSTVNLSVMMFGYRLAHSLMRFFICNALRLLTLLICLFTDFILIFSTHSATFLFVWKTNIEPCMTPHILLFFLFINRPYSNQLRNSLTFYLFPRSFFWFRHCNRRVPNANHIHSCE